MARSPISLAKNFRRLAGVKYTHIPYKGAAQGVTDLIGDQVQWYASSVPTLIGQIRTGKLRALAVSSPKRVDDVANVPTIADSGYKDFGASAFQRDFSAKCLGSRCLIHQFAALEILPRWCAPVMSA
jgi:tripartite-type tricarboxylate transporter receptor subunit TctC